MSQLQNDLLDCGFEKPAMISYCMPSLAHQQLRKLLCIFGSALMFFADRRNACDRGLLDIAGHYHILPQFATVLPVSIFVEVDGLMAFVRPSAHDSAKFPALRAFVPSCLRRALRRRSPTSLALQAWDLGVLGSWLERMRWVTSGDGDHCNVPCKARIWHQPRAYWQVVDSWSSWDFDRELPAHTAARLKEVNQVDLADRSGMCSPMLSESCERGNYYI